MSLKICKKPYCLSKPMRQCLMNVKKTDGEKMCSPSVTKKMKESVLFCPFAEFPLADFVGFLHSLV